MQSPIIAKLSSSQPDNHLIARLATINRVALSLVTAIAASILLAWWFSPFAALLPDGWALMKANTAFCMLLTVVALTLSQPKRSEGQLRAVAVARCWCCSWQVPPFTNTSVAKSLV